MMGRNLRTFVGAILLFAGLFFAAQGAGVVQWPRESFMVNDTSWIYYGFAIAIVGLFMIVMARR